MDNSIKPAYLSVDKYQNKHINHDIMSLCLKIYEKQISITMMFLSVYGLDINIKNLLIKMELLLSSAIGVITLKVNASL